MPRMSHPEMSGPLVVLLGGGPGDESLLTAAGAKWLSGADVVVYDRLVDPALLELCRADAERVHVGKAPGRRGWDQERINDLLIERARQGRLVVRLKGGDPLVFGRGAEEAEALARAGVPFCILPGVTAALAAGASAGIPLTDRRFASSVAFVTGREDPTRPETRMDWEALARIDTLVLYMGVGNLSDVVERLVRAGRDPKTPAATIASASTARQQTVTAPLAELPKAVEAAGIAPPAVTIVGQVVRLRERIAWRERLPLFGKTVMITRARPQGREMKEMLTTLGAAVIEAPAIEIRPPENPGAVDEALRRLGDFDLVVLTSANGAEAFVAACRRLGLDGRALGRAKVAAVGPATASALARHFITADIVPQTFTTRALGEAIRSSLELSGRRVLLARADIAEAALGESLRSAGAEVTEVCLYRTVRPAGLDEPSRAAIRERRLDWIAFASSSAVRNFVSLVQELQENESVGQLLAAVRLAAIGPVTAEAIRAVGLVPTVVAEEHTARGLVEAILRTGG